MSQSVHIWAIAAGDAQTFELFLEEQYDEDDVPMNGFAATQGVTYYDHDWQEAYFLGNPTAPSALREALSGVTDMDAVIALFGSAGAGNCDGLIRLSVTEDVLGISRPRDGALGDIAVSYLGMFDADD
ncbi:MAG: hypothetical protein AAF666_01440 [Pseudomonadota bacterium]